MTSILIKSNLATLAIALLLWACHGSVVGMLLWLAALTIYCGAMLWWLIAVEHAEQSQVPRGVLFPQPMQFVGGSERKGERP